jgi:hypothetical protein
LKLVRKIIIKQAQTVQHPDENLVLYEQHLLRFFHFMFKGSLSDRAEVTEGQAGTGVLLPL